VCYVGAASWVVPISLGPRAQVCLSGCAASSGDRRARRLAVVLLPRGLSAAQPCVRRNHIWGHQHHGDALFHEESTAVLHRQHQGLWKKQTVGVQTGRGTFSQSSLKPIGREQFSY
jgi:hypothetical protein